MYKIEKNLKLILMYFHVTEIIKIKILLQNLKKIMKEY